MPVLAPPPLPPRTTTSDDDEGRRRFRMRLNQVMWTMYTVFITGYFCTFGIIPALIALSVAKHVLVAILMMGLGVDAPRRK
jgi:hypothetical protein